MSLLERIGVEHPVVQAGLGGALARHELAAAVSDAGGLGTVGTIPGGGTGRELDAARERTSRPVAVNMLMPFARAGDWEAASKADVVVSFWGRPRRRTDNLWLHQVGTVEEAQAAQRAGADGIIAQGVEAGGHVRGTVPALELLERVRAALPPGYPVWLAGGIAEAADVRIALDAGAEAAVAGTRFLLTEESGAHPGYKERLLEAEETVLTELFGLAWAAPHRVVPNAATRRWLRKDPRGPAAIRLLNRAATPLTRLPYRDVSGMQRPNRPFFSPAAPYDGAGGNLLDAGALYAGETVARIHDIRPAGEIVRELAG